jgi:hypothetical protein
MISKKHNRLRVTELLIVVKFFNIEIEGKISTNFTKTLQSPLSNTDLHINWNDWQLQQI